jgi:hypothetical protein
MPLAMDDNTAKVLLALIALVPGTISALFAYLIHRQIKTPSGEKLGVVAERAGHLAEVNTALTLGIHNRVHAETPPIEDVRKMRRADVPTQPQ